MDGAIGELKTVHSWDSRQLPRPGYPECERHFWRAGDRQRRQPFFPDSVESLRSALERCRGFGFPQTARVYPVAPRVLGLARAG